MGGRKIRKVAILGSGVMGSRIACHFANIGCEVVLLDIVPFSLNAKEESKGLTLENPQVRNRLVNDFLTGAVKSRPAPLYNNKFANRISTGNFDDNMDMISDCDLILETPDNPLESRIKIIAKPKGKRPQSINQLSGGEKTLTATALLFSLYLLKPAPFCIFDEVDAPLDDANVGRYARMVEEMSKSIQFIYISHNKIAMEMAKQLMGVTMHEAGVSRLVSVDVDEAVQLAAV